MTSASPVTSTEVQSRPRPSQKQTKRPLEASARTFLILSQKIEVLKLYNKGGFSTRKLAEKYGCSKTQITKSLKDKEKINKMRASPGTAQKKSNPEKFTEINNLLWEWYTRARDSNVPVNGPLLLEEAKLIAEELGNSSFKGTNGWLEKWKRRHNLAQMNIAGEEGNVNEETVESWNERVKELTKGYEPQDVWNQDETGCFWRALLGKSLSEKGKRCRGFKNAKQRITASFFGNASGGKETPVLIRVSIEPHCFRMLPDISRPGGAHYFYNNKAWMRTDIMTSVLGKLNNKMKRKGRRIIMFLDNAPCTSSIIKGNVL